MRRPAVLILAAALVLDACASAEPDDYTLVALPGPPVEVAAERPADRARGLPRSHKRPNGPSRSTR